MNRRTLLTRAGAFLAAIPFLRDTEPEAIAPPESLELGTPLPPMPLETKKENKVGLSYAEESDYGVEPTTDWLTLESVDELENGITEETGITFSEAPGPYFLVIGSKSYPFEFRGPGRPLPTDVITTIRVYPRSDSIRSFAALSMSTSTLIAMLGYNWRTDYHFYQRREDHSIEYIDLVLVRRSRIPDAEKWKDYSLRSLHDYLSYGNAIARVHTS